MLLEAGVSPNVTDGKGNTPLHVCESAEVMAALLKAGGDPNTANQVRWGWRALTRARRRHLYTSAAAADPYPLHLLSHPIPQTYNPG